ncbi:MAG: hypothetical protein AAF617_02910 [Bacteroidota bacterium]
MKTHKVLGGISLLLAIFFCYNCADNSKSTDLADSFQLSDNFTISYNLPTDAAVNASQAELAAYAWQLFVALNWESSWTSDNKRATPDTSWELSSSDAQPDLAVWETYMHRIELRPADGKRTKDLSTGKPSYTFTMMDSINLNGLDLSKYWNVLDEDNEIGSAYVFAHKNEHQILYEAKSNLVNYDYVKQYFPTDASLTSAQKRGSAKGIDFYKSLSKAQMCASDSLSSGKNALICLPCADETNEGTIEIKMAFRQLDESKGDDPSRFITKEVVAFRKNPTTKKYDAKVYTFGVIGMHIIRKTQNYPTYVFASWEQVDERNNDMQTLGIDTAGIIVNGIKYVDVDPHRLNPVIERVIPETLQNVNAVVQQKIKSVNAASKWQYYQLIGVQGTPIDYTERTSDNNYFMANYVIESDLTLTQFHGSFTDPFNASIQNVAANGRTYNMGGCFGCHGLAQSNGTDFSFFLDNVGKPVAVPDPYQTFEEAYLASCQDACIAECNAKCYNKCILNCDGDEDCIQKCQSANFDDCVATCQNDEGALCNKICEEKVANAKQEKMVSNVLSYTTDTQ